MPRIRDNIRDCAAYLYPSVATAQAGMLPGGGGFLVGIRSKTDEKHCHPYIVTNRHVIANGSTVVRLNTKEGATDIVELTSDDWVSHPDGDDLAVASIPLHADFHEYMLLDDHRMLLTQETMKDIRIGIGDDVFTVGRLIDHEGKQHDSPTVRFGQVAMMPKEAVMVGDHVQECFLADVGSLGGLSGSPVFVTVHQLRLQNPIEFNHAWFPYLLGVNCGHLFTPGDCTDPSQHRFHESLLSDAHPSGLPFARTGLMLVLPAWRLAQVLNLPRLLQPRSEADSRRSTIGSARFRSRQLV